MHLISALQGNARIKVEDLINRNASFDTIWKALDDFYGNAKNITDATLTSFFSIPKPGNNIQEITEHFTKIKNQCSTVMALDLTAEQLMTHYYLLQIPGQFRSELESKCPSDNYKYTFDILSPKVDEVSRLRKHQQNDNQLSCNIGNTEITAAAGFTEKSKFPLSGNKTDHKEQNHRPNPHNNKNTNSNQNSNQNQGYNQNYNQNHNQNQGYNQRGRDRGGRFDNVARGNARGGGGGARPKFKCYLCEGEGHVASWCHRIAPGPDVRRRLKELERCDACLVHKDDHTTVCKSHDHECRACYRVGHFAATCNGASHPGSWVFKKKST